MEEFIYDETKYIKRQDLKDFEDLMFQYEFMPEDIESENELNIVFQYLVNLTIKAPDLLDPYEYILRMIGQLEPDKELVELQADIEERLFGACQRIAQREDVFNKQVLWGWQENRPLIRGLYQGAQRMWKQGKLKEANELFSKILKTNPDDNVGARYAVKATAEGMSLEEFDERFTTSDDSGTYYRTEELWEWFGEEAEINNNESMKYTVEILPDNSSTKLIDFGGEVLTIQPFESNIEGLALCIKNAGNGRSVRTPIGDTKVLVIEDVSEYGHFWFEYRKSDKKYLVKITID